MSKDTISRQAAIDGVKTLHDVAWKNWHEPTLSANVVLDMIRELPSAQPEQRWIPVTERLPNDDTEVIVSCTDDSGDGEFSYVTTGWHFKGLWIVNNERCFFVRAWQPLPEKPYREE